jgi:hypothetical protein
MARQKSYALAPRLQAAAARFEKSQIKHFRTALGDDPTVGNQVLTAVLAMTRGLLQAGGMMVETPVLNELAVKFARGLLAKEVSPGRLQAHVELEIARVFTLRTDEMAERCLELARMALRIAPGEAVLRFLERLGRCYIAGFFPESVVMCRAVLENAVLERFSRERKPLPSPAQGRSEMRARLHRAEELGWLTRRQRDEAWSVWERGSKAAHRDPNVTKEVLQTIKITVGLLEVLYDDRKRTA